MEEELVVISKSIVNPRNVKKPTTVKKIHLTPWDLSRLRFGYLQRGLLFPKPDPKIDIIISRLQTSLSVALDRFYPLAGRLVKVENDDDTVSYVISCDGSGVEFVHAVARNIELSDVLQLSGSVPRFFSSFFPATGIKNYHGVSRSLLMVQVTEMKDGIFIGFGYNSTVADANSIWRFINAWSEICSKDSGSETFQHRLHLKGWFFDGIDYPIHIPDPINMRERLNPPLQEECFGNVSQIGIATVTVGELLDHGLGWAAMQINKMDTGSMCTVTISVGVNQWLQELDHHISMGDSLFSKESIKKVLIFRSVYSLK